MPSRYLRGAVSVTGCGGSNGGSGGGAAACCCCCSGATPRGRHAMLCGREAVLERARSSLRPGRASIKRCARVGQQAAPRAAAARAAEDGRQARSARQRTVGTLKKVSKHVCAFRWPAETRRRWSQSSLPATASAGGCQSLSASERQACGDDGAPESRRAGFGALEPPAARRAGAGSARRFCLCCFTWQPCQSALPPLVLVVATPSMRL